MADRTQLNLKLSEDRKTRWKEAADGDPEYSSLSHLVRSAVERELSDDAASAGCAVNEGTMRAIRETQEKIHEAVTGQASVLSAVHETVDRSDDKHAKAEVWSVLMVGEGLTPSQVAKRIGGPFDAATVAEYLGEMERDGHVETADGTTYRKAG